MSNAVSTTLPDMIRKAGPLSPITILGDANHTSIEQQKLLMSPDVVRAAAQSGKKFMIVEALSDPIIEDAFNHFAKGDVSEAQLRKWFSTMSVNMTSLENMPQWREAAVQMFIALKENHMQLLEPDRRGTGPLPTELAHPDFVQTMEDSEAALRAGPEAFKAFNEKLIKEKGSDYLDRFNAWTSGEWMDQMNARDYKAVSDAVARAHGAGVLVVWGNEHNQQTNDLDEHLGKDRVRIISVYPDKNALQVSRDGKVYRHQLPDYVYYVKEGVGGRPDPAIDTSHIEHRIGAPTHRAFNDAIESINHNSIEGTLMPGATFPHENVPAAQSAQLPAQNGPATQPAPVSKAVPASR